MTPRTLAHASTWAAAGRHVESGSLAALAIVPVAALDLAPVSLVVVQAAAAGSAAALFLAVVWLVRYRPAPTQFRAYVKS